MMQNEPRLKNTVSPVLPIIFDVRDTILLDVPTELGGTAFIEVLETRKSVREFNSLSLVSIGHLLYLSNRVKGASVNEFGHTIESTNIASPGSLNATSCVLRSPESGGWYHYNARKHTLELIGVSEEELDRFAKTCFSLIPSSENSWLIWYVNNIELLESKYDDPITLAYRDAGGIATTHSLVSQYLGLNYCQIGLHGFNEAQYILNERNLIGVGVALLG